MGLLDFHIKLWDGNEQISVCALKGCLGLVSEARQANLDSLTFSLLRWKSWKLITLLNEELLVQGERFVDSWIKETFIWILAAFVHVIVNLNFEVYWRLEPATLGPSAIAWSSYSVAMVFYYRGFASSQCSMWKSISGSLSVQQYINSDDYEYAISLNLCSSVIKHDVWFLVLTERKF